MSEYTAANPKIITCDPVPGYAEWAGRYVAQMEEVRRDLLEQVQGLTVEQLDWHPDEQTESIGTQLLHLDAIEWSWMHEDLLGTPSEQYPGSWEEALPIRFRLPQVTGRPLEWYLEKMQATRQLTLDILKGMTGADQSRLVGEAEPSSGEEPRSRLYTIDWIVWHVIQHESAHLGQIELLRRLGPQLQV
jgi:uncharacterized damage-inducible protein DinB